MLVTIISLEFAIETTQLCLYNEMFAGRQEFSYEFHFKILLAKFLFFDGESVLSISSAAAAATTSSPSLSTAGSVGNASRTGNLPRANVLLSRNCRDDRGGAYHLFDEFLVQPK